MQTDVNNPADDYRKEDDLDRKKELEQPAIKVGNPATAQSTAGDFTQ